MRFFKSLWRFLTILRNSLANLIFLLVLLFILIVIFSPKGETLVKDAPLLVRISGTLVDELTYEPTVLDLLQGPQEATETLLRDVVSAIDHAKDNSEVTGLVLNMNGLTGASLSKIEEVGQAINRFKTSGKPVVAFADTFGQPQYLLASYADKIYLNDLGTVALTGFAFYNTYFKEALDKLSVKFHLFKVGDYKDAAEPFVRNDMSEASREHNQRWVGNLWQRFTQTIEQNRELESGTVDGMIANMAATVEAHNRDFAAMSKALGLVDDVVSRVELNQLLTEQFGESDEGSYFRAVGFDQYLAAKVPSTPPSGDAIGLIVATGTIIDGSGSKGEIGGDSLARLLQDAAEDESLKALVIRVDSGGGSAFASEVIRDEILRVRAKNIPVIISMSSVAASGGYWLATAADEIWAAPSTITGSIGVWGLIPNVTDAFKRLGLHSDGFSTTPLADIYQIDRPLSDQAKQVIQTGVDSIYVRFISLVAESRDMTPEAVHEIAQGRVWTGEMAQDLGLVDRLGSFNDLLVALREERELGNLPVKVVQHPLSTGERFLQALMENASGLSRQIRTAVFGPELAALSERLPTAPIRALSSPTLKPGLNVMARCWECISPQ